MNLKILYFLLLLFAHTIADYTFQNDFQANFKATNNFILFIHAFIWTGTVSIVLFLTGRLSYFDLIQLLLLHFIIDKIKCNKKDKSKALTTDLYLDQALHVIQLLIAFIY